MFVITSLLILFLLSFKFLSNYIKNIRTGDPNESDITYWMFSYDFRSPNKDWVPEDQNLLKRKRSRNTLVFVLYLIVFCIFGMCPGTNIVPGVAKKNHKQKSKEN